MVSAVSNGSVSLLGVHKIGRYEVLSHLASGGMGQVYLARTKGLGGFERQVVVKTLDLSITDDDEAFVTMFLDEARLVGALHHQYIAPVYEVGCDEEGRYYLVMDFVHGETTEAVFRASAERSMPVPLPFALTVVSCVASALDYAHGLCADDGTPLEIVHRDISLSNVMVGYDGGVKLIDFGIAKAANRATKTQVGTLKGKIGYLAPEQVLRKNVDHRADIFSLGIVLYELTTGKRAFRAGSDLITLERITSGEIKPPTSFIPNYPVELERIVLQALQVDPDDRFQDAGSMGRELEALAARMSLPLGHAALIEVMARLFGEQRRRRRMARGSDVQTDPSIHIIPVEDDEEKTPVVALPLLEETARHGALSSAGDVALGEAGPVERPTPPQRTSVSRMEKPTLPLAPPRAPSPRPRVAEATPALAQPILDETPSPDDFFLPVLQTGPQLPVVIFRTPTAQDISELPTHIAPPRLVRGDTSELPTQIATDRLVRTKSITSAVVDRVKPAFSAAARRWLLLCALFAIAVVASIVVAFF